MKNSAYTKPLNLDSNSTDLLCIFIKDQAMLWSYKNVKKLKLKEIWSSSDQKCACSDNPGQNICNKIEKSSKIALDKESLLSTFSFFFAFPAKPFGSSCGNSISTFILDIDFCFTFGK